MRMFPSFGDSSSHDPFDGREASLARAGLLVTLLFLASLTMFFIASLVGYIIIRYNSAGSPDGVALVLPNAFLYSTGLLVVASVVMHFLSRKADGVYGDLQPKQEVKRASILNQEDEEDEALPDGVKHFRYWLYGAMLTGVMFLIVQTPSLLELVDQIRENLLAKHRLAGLAGTLIAIHAAHVIGGFVPLVMMLFQTYMAPRHRLHRTTKYTAIYWHFLDVIWIIMLGTLYLTA